MYAYNRLYLNDAATNLGEFFDYMINVLGRKADAVFELLAYSKIGHSFEKGNPSVVTGISGHEMAIKLIYEIEGFWELTEYDESISKSREYWAGWALAHYQWERDISFRRLIECGITMSYVVSRYILHEADISKFITETDILIQRNQDNTESRLKRLRKYHCLTQKALSEKSGVTLRMIQLYEQGQNDIRKASVDVVYSLAKALDCTVEDLI